MSDREVKEDEEQQHLQREQQDEEAIMPHEKEKEQEEDEEQGQAKTSKRKRKRKRKKKSNQDDNDEDDDKEEQTEEEMPPPQVEEDSKTKQVDRTVFVEGIPFTCTVDQVRDFFTTHLAGDNNNNHPDLVLEDIRCPVWHDSGRLRGYGHVVFGTTAARDAALALSGKYLQNRYLTIQKAQAPKGHGHHAATATTIDHSHPSATIALHNLSYDATEDDISVVMEKFGSIAPGGVRIVRHSDSGRSKGFAYVSFENVETATLACQAAPISIAGRPCRLDYDHGRVRGSFRTADRKLWHKEFHHKRQKG